MNIVRLISLLLFRWCKDISRLSQIMIHTFEKCKKYANFIFQAFFFVIVSRIDTDPNYLCSRNQKLTINTYYYEFEIKETILP